MQSLVNVDKILCFVNLLCQEMLEMGQRSYSKQKLLASLYGRQQ